MELDQKVTDDWMKAREVIKQFLRDLAKEGYISTDDDHLDHNAAALIARLAHAGMTIDSK